MARQLKYRFLLLCAACWPWLVHADDIPTVAAASSLQFALSEVAEQFTEQTGKQLRLNFGSSGNLRRQIAQGAPFELFLSADERYIEWLHEEGFTEGTGALYARGRLVWLQRAGSGFQLDKAEPLAAAKRAIEEGGRIALANPEHAPYGVAARQALEHAGLWQHSPSLRVLGENVSQAAQFSLSSDTYGGLVAYSLALSAPLRERSDYVLIPQQWHAPLNQRMALIKGAGETAHAFYAYLQQEDARAVFEKNGFSLPDPAMHEAH